MKELKYIVAPVTIPEPVFKAAKKRAAARYGKRGFSRHVSNVLAEDLKNNPQPNIP